MSNDLNNEYNISSVLFFRDRKSYYYNFNGKIHEINSITINKLKENLSVPFKVEFSDLSRAQIERIIGELLDSTIDVKIKKTYDKTNNLLKFEALFIRQKNT